MGAGVTARHAARERSRDSGRSEGSLQRIRSRAGCAVCVAGAQPGAGETDSSAVPGPQGTRRAAQRSGRDLPHRYSRTQPACRRQAVGDDPLEHGLCAVDDTRSARAATAGQNDGFPNGRRLVDDVVDIELRALAGATPFTPTFNVSPNNLLGDGVDGNDKPFLAHFPYVAHPFPGFEQ